MATLALSVAGQVVGGLVGGPIGATVGRALGALAGSAIDATLFGEKPQAAGPRPDIRLQGSSEGGAIPRLYGWSRLAGNIIWATELEEITREGRGGKGTAPTPDETEILASFAVAFCEGEVQRLGRVWADGQLLELEGLNARFYRGSETQAADSLIEAKQGTAPAYRGLCYLVFERLPLTEFGNRVPNITVELCRVVGELEPLIRSVTVIPGATEFGYDPHVRVLLVAPGAAGTENAHQSAEVSDWTLSLDELQALCPNLEHVALVVSWFGDDLRAGHCTIRPKVEAANRVVKGASWSVAGVSRGAAQVVSQHDGGPAYGGTPSDAAVRAAIADLRHRGLEVTLYPMVLMDIPEGNPLGQPAYPWRGRISGAAADVPAFVGTSSGWGLRRMVRHYADLARDAGADALVLASELVGLTTIRSDDGFPFVEALVGLAEEAKALAPGVKLTYAADWSEYHGFQPADAPGDKYFHLDPLWASEAIDAVGIDNYMPVSDWRDGETHADFALWDGPHALGYLTAGIAGGEGFDWFYASDADRLAGMRTPIADAAFDEDWVWRFKDIAGWWGHSHHERVGWVRATDPTAWEPGMKPVWFTELGCGAVDKGSNQPNVFPDGKSAEGGRPYFSSGAPDGLMQRQFLRAQLAYWDASPMVARVSVWTWDSRPYPAFPGDAESWSDAPNHAAGHWLSGRLGALASDELAAAVAADWGTEVSGAAALPLVHGLAVEGVVSARDALQGLLGASGLSMRDGEDGLTLVSPSARAAVEVEDVVLADGPMRSRRRPDPSEAVGRLALTYTDRERHYLAGTATAMWAEIGAVAGENSGLVLDAAGARTAAERALVAASAGRDTLELTLPPSFAALEVGDVIAVDGEGEGPFEITEIRDGLARKISARAVAPMLHPAVLSERPSRGGTAPVPVPEPVMVAAHLPGEAASPGTSRLLLAAWASPWPGSVEVQLASTGTALARLMRPAAMGELVTPLEPGPLHLWDGQGLEVKLYGGHLADVDEVAALAGSNRIAVETDADAWEVIGFAGAELIAAGTYRLTRLLRGEGMTESGGAAIGRRVAVLDEAVTVLPVEPGWVGDTLGLRAFAGRRDAEGTAFSAELGLGPLLPLAPDHLRAARDGSGDVALSWVRRSRADAGSWAALEVGLDFVPEAYRLTILDGPTPVRMIEATTPTASYTAADQIVDFGALPASFDFTVSQLSAELGPGAPATGSFNG